MRKFFLLVTTFMFVFQVTAFAQISRNAGSNYTEIISNYDTNYQIEDNGVLHERLFIANVMSMRSFGSIGSDEYRYLMLWANPIDPNYKNQLVVFSKKNPPTIEVVKNEKSSIVVIKKISNIGDAYLWFQLKQDELKEAYNADKVYIVFPTNQNGVKKFEIPKSIVSEWETVLSSDLKEIRKEIMGK